MENSRHAPVIADSAQSHDHPRNRVAASLSRLSRTKANGRVGLVCDTVIGFAFVWFAKSSYDVSVMSLTVALLTGLALFTFIEYAFHRWLFHGSLDSLRRGHWQHHLFPHGDDSLPFFVPPLAMTVVAVVLATAMPGGVALSFVGGLASGYALYGISHILIHSRQFSHSGLRRWAASHHVHHYHPDKNFGVTSPLWDVVLGTRYVSKRPSKDEHRRRG